LSFITYKLVLHVVFICNIYVLFIQKWFDVKKVTDQSRLGWGYIYSL